MEAIDALKKRRSIRSFKNNSVDRETVKEILDCARLAPSANNIQPWEFVVVENAAMRKEIASLTDYGGFIREAPVLIVVLSKNTKYYLEDGCAATMNILNAAYALGLGSCWVAGDKKAYANKVKELLKVPPGFSLISLIPIGYQGEKGWSMSSKRTLSEIIHWESF